MQCTENILGVKMKIFNEKKNDFFFLSLLKTYSVDTRYNYPQSMFWIKNKKKYVYPCKPRFFNIKVGFKGVYFSGTCFPDEDLKVRTGAITGVIRVPTIYVLDQNKKNVYTPANPSFLIHV